MRNYNPWRVLLAFVLTPVLWPVAFILIAMATEGFIDPLLGGLQNILYWPAIFWIFYVFVLTVIVAKWLRLRRTIFLYIAVCVVATLLPYLIIIVSSHELRGLADIGQLFDADTELLIGMAFFTGLSLVTGGLFTIIGGLEMWQAGQKPATIARSE